VLEDPRKVVDIVIENMMRAAYAKPKTRHSALHSHLSAMGVLLRNAEFMVCFKWRETCQSIIKVCIHLTRRSPRKDEVQPATRALYQAIMLLSSGLVNTRVEVTEIYLECGLISLFFKTERLLWCFDGTRVGKSEGDSTRMVTAILKLMGQCIEDITPLLSLRAIMRVALKSVAHLHASSKGLEESMLSHSPEVQQFSNSWEEFTRILARSDEWYNMICSTVGIYDNRCAYKVSLPYPLEWENN